MPWFQSRGSQNFAITLKKQLPLLQLISRGKSKKQKYYPKEYFWEKWTPFSFGFVGLKNFWVTSYTILQITLIRSVFRQVDPGIFYWGVQTLVQKGLLNFFVANYFSQRQSCVSQSVNVGCHWHRKYCFASRGKQILGGYPKTITLLNIPGI